MHSLWELVASMIHSPVQGSLRPCPRMTGEPSAGAVAIGCHMGPQSPVEVAFGMASRGGPRWRRQAAREGRAVVNRGPGLPEAAKVRKIHVLRRVGPILVFGPPWGCLFAPGDGAVRAVVVAPGPSGGGGDPGDCASLPSNRVCSCCRPPSWRAGVAFSGPPRLDFMFKTTHRTCRPDRETRGPIILTPGTPRASLYFFGDHPSR